MTRIREEEEDCHYLTDTHSTFEFRFPDLPTLRGDLSVQCPCSIFAIMSLNSLHL